MAKPLTDGINALTRYSNSVTGASDTTLSEAVATLANGYGHGDGGLQLIDTITVAEDTRSVNIDFTRYSAYDIIIVTEDVELTASDWLYYVDNSTEPQGGTYNNGSKIKHQGVAMWKMILGGDGGLVTGFASNVASNGIFAQQKTNATVNNVLVYTYVATKLIKAGSTFKIYAGNYADLK